MHEVGPQLFPGPFVLEKQVPPSRPSPSPPVLAFPSVFLSGADVCLYPTLWGIDFCCICLPSPPSHGCPRLPVSLHGAECSGIDGRTQRWPRPRRSLGHLFYTSAQIFPVQTPGLRAPLEVWGTLRLQIQVTGQMLVSMGALTPPPPRHTWEQMTLGQHLLPPSYPLP